MKHELLPPIALMRCHRDPAYLKYVRSKPSCISGTDQSIVAHHVKILGGGGMALKPSDYLAVPLEHAEHQKLHCVGEAEFWMEHKIKPSDVIEALLKTCLEPDTDIKELYESPSAVLVFEGRIRVLIEAVSTWRGTK